MGSKIRDFSASVIRKIFGLLEFFLFLRVILEFLGANPAAVVVDYFYRITGFFTFPFNSIFPSVQLWGRVIDIVTISAIIAYWIAFEIIMKFLTSKKIYY